MNPLTFISVLACTETLWRRKHTWRSQWDAAATAGIALLGIDVILMEPAVSDALSPLLHRITGLWNVEDMVGHLMHLEALWCLLYMALSRLKRTAAERRRMMRIRLELPGILIMSIAIALFIRGVPDRDIGDVVLRDPETVLCWYWLVLGGAALYVSGSTIWALSIVARNPVARKTSNVYIFACSLSIACVLAGFADLIHPAPQLIWSMIRIELLAYSCAALYSWKYRVPAKPLDERSQSTLDGASP
jgi:hypothetical protein